MNITEARALLSLISATYDRAVPPGKDQMWVDTLHDVPVALARQALIEAMRESEWPPSPAMVLRHARAITEQQRLADKRTHRAAALEAAPEPADHALPAGREAVSFVWAGLAGHRKANGGPLGLEAAALLAAELVEDWREEHPSAPVSSRTGEPCVNPSCQCTHTGGCEAGWIQYDATSVAPCKTCNPRRHAILTAGDRRTAAQHNLRDLSDLKQVPA